MNTMIKQKTVETEPTPEQYEKEYMEKRARDFNEGLADMRIPGLRGDVISVVDRSTGELAIKVSVEKPTSSNLSS